ncbi:hypothetical protein TVAG_470030 [Trichomonas vaginalis G3]|uniref:Uncharacterized protein n=1 Tax=Trichomonas vaginalis (strain ATCC PRA-98 / G3) TaxID=412133 RepID=A2FE10_TRIV3|nr:armadillo (ARM) repeat-containing protein family [Trichomonas vaginalis G3]EAX96838.1 hypothetical protein TVAG_470030 [Trichomonas vaginalis G3]KAI5520697.1 armadillo (ARM) repeat-containing protein family [Trichomonas vaginalis G3]|eukprot:XP_001309768.1 hypothetical protein [Trichomonas vaginalis G3]
MNDYKNELPSEPAKTILDSENQEDPFQNALDNERDHALGQLQAIANNEASAETYMKLLDFITNCGKELEEFLIFSNAIRILGESLNSSSTNTCSNSLHIMAAIAYRSHKARSECIDYIHIILKLMRGPSILPYAVELLQVIVLYEPWCIQQLQKDEQIFDKLFNYMLMQLDNYKISYLCTLVNSLLKYYPDYTPSEKSFNFILQLFMGVNFRDPEVLSSIITIYTTFAKKFESNKINQFFPSDVFERLCELTTTAPLWDNTSSVISRLLELWNLLIVKYGIILFAQEAMGTIFETLLGVFPNSAVKSRFYFLFSNIAAIPEFAEPFFLSGAFDAIYQNVVDMPAIEKENFFFTLCNLVKTLGPQVCNRSDFAELLSECVSFAPSSRSPDFGPIFLEFILISYNFNNHLFSAVDLDDLLEYLEEMIDTGSEDGQRLAIIAKQTIFPE